MKPLFPLWLESLEQRHLSALTFQEVRRAVQALSTIYVERREDALPRGAARRGAGKRAALALFYGPLHFATVSCVVRALGAAAPVPERICDLGCGTGAAGAAWAIEAGGAPVLDGVDVDRWAIGEAVWSWRVLGLRGKARIGQLERTRLPGAKSAVLLAYAANELPAETRELTLAAVLRAAERGARVLVVEPIARRVTPWWPDWAARFAACGGRADEWRFPVELPERLRLLDRAAGLDHRELTARSLYL